MTSNQKYLTGSIVKIAAALSLIRISSIIQLSPYFNRNWVLLLIVAVLVGFVIQLIAFAEEYPFKKIPPKK